MSKKPPVFTEAQFLAMLESSLPHLASGPDAARIYEGIARRVRFEKHLAAFARFCEEGALADCEENTMQEFASELQTKFGMDEVSIAVNHDKKSVEVEIVILPGAQTGRAETTSKTFIVRVDATIALAEEQKPAPWVPFPFALPGDPDNVWTLARREDFGPDEAARALMHMEAEFWETSRGLKLLKKRVEKCFAEFIAHVPASALKDSNLKRHYKEPEALKVAASQAGGEA